VSLCLFFPFAVNAYRSALVLDENSTIYQNVPLQKRVNIFYFSDIPVNLNEKHVRPIRGSALVHIKLLLAIKNPRAQFGHKNGKTS